MRRPGINKTRERIMQYIRNFIEEKGYAPTVRDILKGCALSSTAVVQHHLNVLEREERIHRDPQVFRSIQLPYTGNKKTVPLLGTIAAGNPIPVPGSETWTNQPLEMLEIPGDMVTGKDTFALKVKGLSMIDALIDDGDTVLMQHTSVANNGDMVAVWLKNEHEVTLKRIYFEPDRICLKPANKFMDPIFQDPANVEIQGKVTGIIRKL